MNINEMLLNNNERFYKYTTNNHRELQSSIHEIKTKYPQEKIQKIKSCDSKTSFYIFKQSNIIIEYKPDDTPYEIDCESWEELNKHINYLIKNYNDLNFLICDNPRTLTYGFLFINPNILLTIKLVNLHTTSDIKFKELICKDRREWLNKYIQFKKQQLFKGEENNDSNE